MLFSFNDNLTFADAKTGRHNFATANSTSLRQNYLPCWKQQHSVAAKEPALSTWGFVAKGHSFAAVFFFLWGGGERGRGGGVSSIHQWTQYIIRSADRIAFYLLFHQSQTPWIFMKLSFPSHSGSCLTAGAIVAVYIDQWAMVRRAVILFSPNRSVMEDEGRW